MPPLPGDCVRIFVRLAPNIRDDPELIREPVMFHGWIAARRGAASGNCRTKPLSETERTETPQHGGSKPRRSVEQDGISVRLDAP